MISLKSIYSPGQCGSVGWVSSHKPKDRGFNSQSGQTPGLLVWSPVGACTGGNQSMLLSHIDVSLSHQCFSPSLSPSLPLSRESIKMNKIKLKIKNKKHWYVSYVKIQMNKVNKTIRKDFNFSLCIFVFTKLCPMRMDVLFKRKIN